MDNRSHLGPSGYLPPYRTLRTRRRHRGPSVVLADFLRRGPAGKWTIGDLMAGSLTLPRSGVGRSLAQQIDAPNQLWASPRVRPMVLPVHAIEPARNHGYRPVRRPTKSPGSLRGFLRLGVCFKAASAPPSARSVRNMRGLQCVVEHGVQRRGDIGGRVRGVEEAGRRAFLQAGRNKRNVVVGIGVFIAGKARIHG